MTANVLIKEHSNIETLSQEARQILEILDQIENHTATLRNKLIMELKPRNDAVRLKLDQVE